MKYPDIIGIHLGMTFDEVNETVIKNGYNKLQQADKNLYYVHSKDSKRNSDPLFFDFLDNRLLYFHIHFWKEVFEYNDEFTFDNMFEVFTNYFLRSYEYEIINGPEYMITNTSKFKTTTIKNSDWGIKFTIDSDAEMIMYYKDEKNE